MTWHPHTRFRRRHAEPTASTTSHSPSCRLTNASDPVTFRQRSSAKQRRLASERRETASWRQADDNENATQRRALFSIPRLVRRTSSHRSRRVDMLSLAFRRQRTLVGAAARAQSNTCWRAISWTLHQEPQSDQQEQKQKTTPHKLASSAQQPS